MRLLARFVAAAAWLAAFYVFAHPPLHEYWHCLFFWARGGGECEIVFAAPLQDVVGYPGTHAYALTDAIPAYEHPVIYGCEAALALLGAGLILTPWLRSRLKRLRLAVMRPRRIRGGGGRGGRDRHSVRLLDIMDHPTYDRLFGVRKK